MTTGEPPATPDPLLADPRWHLVGRVAASASFQKAIRLRELLLFVCERTLREPDKGLPEGEIARVVFGRAPGPESEEDTLVRVQASELRKRLQQYFSSDGADEPVVIEIPKGTYKPVFRDRHAPASEAEASPAFRPHSRAAIIAAGFAVLFLLLSGVLYVQNRTLHRRLSAGGPPRPMVDRLWRQMFGDGQRVTIVLGDAMATVFHDLVRSQLSPQQYHEHELRIAPETALSESIDPQFARALMFRRFTSVADARLAWTFGSLAATHGTPTDVILAREANEPLFRSQHAILAGPRRANPWVELFEERLNFRTRFNEATKVASFENVAPASGEATSYVVAWHIRGYCRVAWLPNLAGTGSVLLVSPTDMVSGEAGASFLTTERSVESLARALGVGGSGVFPHFEVILQTDLTAGRVTRLEAVAVRAHTI